MTLFQVRSRSTILIKCYIFRALKFKVQKLTYLAELGNGPVSFIRVVASFEKSPSALPGYRYRPAWPSPVRKRGEEKMDPLGGLHPLQDLMTRWRWKNDACSQFNFATSYFLTYYICRSTEACWRPTAIRSSQTSQKKSQEGWKKTPRRWGGRRRKRRGRRRRRRGRRPLPRPRWIWEASTRKPSAAAAEVIRRGLVGFTSVPGGGGISAKMCHRRNQMFIVSMRFCRFF